ncbi:MAG: DUF4440 domain-containing protein [Armatimonadetes bacterium]|nr:DUF4440 domain-containing protein [Armatimonadota bacterium]
MRNILVLLALSSLMLVGCQPAVPGEDAGTGTVAAAPAALSDDDLAAHQELTEKVERAFLEADWDLLATCYTDDAVLMGADRPEIVGREAIKEFYSQFPPAKSGTMADTEVVGFGDYAYVKGAVNMVFDIPGRGEYEENGKYLEIRKRQDDGSWLITHDMYNSDAAFGSE